MNEVVTGRGTHVGRVGVYLQSSKDDTVDGGEVHVPQQLRLLPQGHDALGFDGTHDVRYLKVEKRKKIVPHKPMKDVCGRPYNFYFKYFEFDVFVLGTRQPKLLYYYYINLLLYLLLLLFIIIFIIYYYLLLYLLLLF